MSSHREWPNSTILSQASLLAAYRTPGSALVVGEPIQLEAADAATKGNTGEIIIQNAQVSFASQAQITTAGDYAFFAGLRGDPFFFDLMGFCNNLRFTGTDYFSDKDVFGIMLAAPPRRRVASGAAHPPRRDDTAVRPGAPGASPAIQGGR